MENILLLDTSIATNNIGDEIIMECTRKELAPIFRNKFVRSLPTHVSSFNWYQVWRKSTALMSFANSYLKFVGGSNILTPNLFTHYPQWNINIFNYKPVSGCILVGVGAGAGAEAGSNWYTRYVYKHLLNSDYYHSMRDERSKKYMDYLGKKAINTGCVSMWMLTPDFCKSIPRKKADKVVFTLTAGYGIDMDADGFMIDALLKNYKEVYFFPQCVGDYEYLQGFKNIMNINNVKILEASKAAYDEYLTNNDTDYVGTRLHGGVYAMRHARRTIIVAIDERARAINYNNHLNCVDRCNIRELDAVITSEFETKIQMDFDAIRQWKSQFKEYNI